MREYFNSLRIGDKVKVYTRDYIDGALVVDGHVTNISPWKKSILVRTNEGSYHPILETEIYKMYTIRSN
jgi:hypothetical protein